MLAAYRRLPEADEFAGVEIYPDTFEIRIIAQELDEGFNVLGWGTTPRTTRSGRG